MVQKFKSNEKTPGLQTEKSNFGLLGSSIRNVMGKFKVVRKPPKMNYLKYFLKYTK